MEKMKKVYRVLCLVFGVWCFVFGLTGCKYILAHQKDGIAAEVSGQKLYETEVLAVVRGLTGEDSARVRSEYIQQWATDILIQEKANEYMTPEIERLVADYRRSLCVYEYEKEIIDQRINTVIADSVMLQFYESHQERFVLQDDIFKGLLLVIPQDAPEQEALMNTLKTLDEEDLQFIEQYAYQNAQGYELFLDEWKTANQLLVRMPSEHNDLGAELKNKKQVIVQDSLNKYILQVTDKSLRGNTMPYDYAKRDIQKIILSQKQNTFIKQEHERLYKEGVRLQKVKIYEQEQGQETKNN